uniref:Uncharacterized protein n=1 Tax=viral metagenome TaxID=1070528 RepID=A0A6H1Z7Y8_9ZZZZ
MTRIIINIAAGIDHQTALDLVAQVVRGGRVSDGGYCTMTVTPEHIVCASRTAAGTDVFRVEER